MKVQDNLKSREGRKEKYKGHTKTVPLCHGSLYIYIHTAHDDEMYYHCLDFVTQKIKSKRVRLVLVFRWLSVKTYFRQNPNDERCNRYSTMDKHAFESMDQRNRAYVWWKGLGYVIDGCNIVKPLMDPIPTKAELDEEKKIVAKQEKE